jgi:hypothetical protein
MPAKPKGGPPVPSATSAPNVYCGSPGTMILEALEDRLKVLEDEILRLIDLAAESSDLKQQDSCYGLAKDLQREARELRLQIKKL